MDHIAIQTQYLLKAVDAIGRFFSAEGVARMYSGGFEMQLEARGEATFENLVQAADTLMYYAQKRKELTGLSSSLHV